MSPAAILAILQVVETLAVLLESIPGAKEEFDTVLADVRKFVSEGRDPTPEELGRIVTKSKRLSSRIQNS